MKKIGKEVLFVAPSDESPRIGNPMFLRLNDGGIMLAYTQHYNSTHWDDHTPARIMARTSYDEGETFGEAFVLLERDEGSQNAMLVSLLRMANGDLGVIYVRKDYQPDNGITCMPLLRRSPDEGKTFSDPVPCTDLLGYYTPQNSVIRLRSGRILFPMTYCGERYDADGTCTLEKSRIAGFRPARACVMYSDDDGYTWHRLSDYIESPLDDRFGFAEPGIYEHEDGELWMWFRTGYGFQYESRSTDDGKTWSKPIPNFCFTSPDAPLHVNRIHDRVVGIFNPYSYNCLRTAVEAWNSPKRTPLVMATCKRDGRSFDPRGKLAVNEAWYEVIDNSFIIEDDESNSYCYPSSIETKDGMLVAYFHSNNTPICLNSAKVTKVYWSELES